jgi:hypothetical protein
MSKGAKAVALKLGGGKAERTYWLEYDIDKMCLLEDLLDLDIEEITQQLVTNTRVGFKRAVLWAGLQNHQPGIDLKAAGELFTLPGSALVNGQIIAAINKAFPDPEAAEGAPGPQEAATE